MEPSSERPVWSDGLSVQTRPPPPSSEPLHDDTPRTQTAANSHRLGRAPWGRRRTLLVGLAAAVVLAGALFFVTGGSGSSTPSSACSLLGNTEASSILVRNVQGHSARSPSGFTVCQYVSLPASNGSASPKTLSVFYGSPPPGFPSATLQRVGTPVRIGGQTARWVNYEPIIPGRPVPQSDDILVAVSHGREISIEADARNAKQIEQSAMGDALSAL